MTLTVTEYDNVADRATELGCTVPAGIGILPENFLSVATRQEFLVRAEGASIRTLYRGSQVPVGDFLLAGERAAFIHNKSFDWVATLFIAGSLISENPALVSIALNMMANYLTDLFRGNPGQEVELNLVVEKTKSRTCKKLTYKGPPSGLSSIAETVVRLANE